MTSGRNALRQLDASIADARKSVARAGDVIDADARSMAALERRQLDAFQRFAEIRLDFVRDRDFSAALRDVEKEAAELIDRHEAAVDAMREKRTACADELSALENARRALEDDLDAAIAAHEDAADKTQARLAGDTAYVALSAAAKEADAIAERAQSKLETARQTREEKGAPYEDDALFSYLWKRKFGTKEYRAFPLFALMDNWVARLIRYRDARLNYARLLELPERLAEHLDFVEASAENAQTALAAFERDALIADGVDALRDAAAKIRDAIEEKDQEIAAAEERERTIIVELDAAAAGDAGPLSDARTLIAEALRDKPVPDLRVLAAETATEEDDRIVDDLISLKRQILELEDSRDAAARAARRNTAYLSDLEGLRRRFKRSRYDSPYSDFSGKDLLGVLIGELARGVLSQDDVWRRLKRAHRTRRRDWDDGFGGRDWRGGFGLPDDWGAGDFNPSDWSDVAFPRSGRRSRRSSWPRSPRPPRRAPRPPKIRIPRGRRGKGGFRTGGGF
ncbi:MAG: hypothetical protein AAGJ87_02215 [Pseudomonadota bacterium]